MRKRILVADASETILEICRSTLTGRGYEAGVREHLEIDGVAAINHRAGDLDSVDSIRGLGVNDGGGLEGVCAQNFHIDKGQPPRRSEGQRVLAEVVTGEGHPYLLTLPS